MKQDIVVGLMTFLLRLAFISPRQSCSPVARLWPKKDIRFRLEWERAAMSRTDVANVQQTSRKWKAKSFFKAAKKCKECESN